MIPGAQSAQQSVVSLEQEKFCPPISIKLVEVNEMESGKKTLRIVLSVVLVAATLVCGVYVYHYESKKPDEARIESAKKDKEEEKKSNETTEEEETKDVNTYDTENEETNVTPDPSEPPAPSQSSENEAQPETPSADADAVASQAVLPELDFNEGTLLNLPVSGKILIPYNMDKTVYFSTLDSYRCNPAVMIEAAVDTPVAVVANSQVVSITEDAVTGTTVTMDMGNGYQAVYGQLKDVNVEQGQTVASGTVIANINTPTKYFTKEGSNLYFALQKDGSPLDPSLYLPPETE